MPWTDSQCELRHAAEIEAKRHPESVENAAPKPQPTSAVAADKPSSKQAVGRWFPRLRKHRKRQPWTWTITQVNDNEPDTVATSPDTPATSPDTPEPAQPTVSSPSNSAKVDAKRPWWRRWLSRWFG